MACRVDLFGPTKLPLYASLHGRVRRRPDHAREAPRYAMPSLSVVRQQIRANLLPDEDEALRRLVETAGLTPAERKAISARAAVLVNAVRRSSDPRLMRMVLSA